MEYADLKILVEQAIDKLNKSKQITLILCDFLESIFEAGLYNVEAIDETGAYLNATFTAEEISEPRKPDEPQRIPMNDIWLLRIAKKLWEAYKNRTASTTISGTISNTLNGNTISGNTISLSPTATSNKIYCQGELVASNITDMEDKIKELEQERDNLKQELADLKNQLDTTTAMKDIIWQTLQEKGIL